MKFNFIVVLEDGSRHPKVLHDRPKDYDIDRMCLEVLTAAGIRTKRNNPQNHTVRVLAQDIVQGEIQERVVSQKRIQPHLEPMTLKEYEVERDDLLNQIPEAFRSFAGTNSWDHGHSAGYEEVINYLNDLVTQLKPAIEAYAKWLTKPKPSHSARMTSNQADTDTLNDR